MIRPVALITATFLTVVQSLAWAVEVRNLRSGQEGKRAYLQYDLAGKPGEKEADVTVSIEIGGERYSSDKLTLSGNFGKKIKVGIGKRIWWNLLKDMPAGFDGEISWDLEAYPTPEHLALTKAQNELAAKEQSEREKRLQIQADEQRQLHEEQERQHQARLKAEQDLKAAEKITAQKADQERLAREKAKADVDRLASQKAEVNRVAKAKLAALKAAEERKADEQRKEREEQERQQLARLKAEEERKKAVELIAKEERLAREKAETLRIAQAKADADRLARQKEEVDRVAKAKLAAQKATEERKAAELVATHKAEQEQLSKINIDKKSKSAIDLKSTSAPVTSLDGPLKPMKYVVLDTSSGLMWAKLGDDTTDKLDYSRASGYITKMNQEKFGGFSDWHMPEPDEAKLLFASAASIADATKNRPYKVLLKYFPNLENWNYWLKTTTAGNTPHASHSAWHLDIEDGAVGLSRRIDSLCILPVRKVME